ncbi:MAG: transcriptional regulator with XRE-family HTH domain [Halioglobus sp.]|jgi:transcriptional regulator with XRE-family HTH domain
MISEHSSNQHIMAEIGSRFSAARINMDISQTELSDRSGVSPKTIGHLENGRKSTGLLNMIAIMRALNLIHEIEHFMPKPPPSAKSFIAEGGKIKVRKRASSHSNQRQGGAPKWKWGDED